MKRQTAHYASTAAMQVFTKQNTLGADVEVTFKALPVFPLMHVYLLDHVATNVLTPRTPQLVYATVDGRNPCALL